MFDEKIRSLNNIVLDQPLGITVQCPPKYWSITTQNYYDFYKPYTLLE